MDLQQYKTPKIYTPTFFVVKGREDGSTMKVFAGYGTSHTNCLIKSSQKMRIGNV